MKNFLILCLLFGALLFDANAYPFDEPLDTIENVVQVDTPIVVDVNNDTLSLNEILLPIYPRAERKLNESYLEELADDPLEEGEVYVDTSFNNNVFILAQDTASTFYQNYSITEDQSKTMISLLPKPDRDSLINLDYAVSHLTYDVLSKESLSKTEAYNRLYSLTRASIYSGWAAHNYNLRLLSASYLIAHRYDPGGTEEAFNRMISYGSITHSSKDTR